MPTSRKQPKAGPTDEPQPNGPETTPELMVSIALTPDEPPAPTVSLEPPLGTMTLGEEDERPGIDLQIGKVADGYVNASVHVERSPAGIPLGRVEWYVDGQLVGTNKGARADATWDISRSLLIAPGTHTISVWVWNSSGSGRNHRDRSVTYSSQPPVDKQPPSYTIFAPDKVGSLDGKATISISGTAQDASGVATVEWSRDDKAYEQAATADQWAHWSFAFSVESYGPQLFYVRFTDTKGNRTAAVRQVEVVKPTRFDDINDLISAPLYLKDLLDYASSHVQTRNGPLTAAVLEGVFYQPFGSLTDRFLKAGQLPINQVRLCIEVLRNYLSSLRTDPGPVGTPAPVGRWTFEEGTGTTTADVTGNGSTGTLQGPTWAAGRSGGALSFDGVDDYVLIGNSARLKMTTTMSLCAWIYPQGPGTKTIGGIIVNKEAEYEVARYPDGSIRWAFANSNPGWKWINTGFIAPQDQWTHLAVVYDNGTVTTYANGQKVHTYAGAGPITSLNPALNDMRIGGRLQYGPQNFQGLIDDVRIYNTALFAEQIVASLLPPPPLVTAGGGTTIDGGAKQVDQVFASAQARYCMMAYQALLAHIGTSYEEIRLAHGAAGETRAALADKLGIPLEHLDELFLAPSEITEAGLEKLFGLADTTVEPLEDIDTPSLQKARLEYLRNFWDEEDWPNDAYTQLLLPIIDPDVIGPDDLRQPTSGQAPFDLWQNRRVWVDARLKALTLLTKPVNGQPMPDMAALFDAMYQPVTYANASLTAWQNIQPTEFDQLRDDLQGGDSDKRQLATARIKDNLHLSVESFTRLLTASDNAALAASDPRITIGPEEWQAVYAILVQAQKVAFFPTWIVEEQAQKISLNPKLFWISQREPQIGDWPPAIPAGYPLIDPDALKPDDLSDPMVGKLALDLLKARRSALAAITKDLRRKRETAGFEAMLRLALGDPHPGDPLQYNLDELQNDLNGIDKPEQVAKATRIITEHLYLTIEAFNRLMSIRESDAKTDPLKKPTVAEYAEVYRLLTRPRKIKHEFPQWIQDEGQAHLQYWNVYKARLPGWRASAEDRQRWQQALRDRSRAPVVDPDLIGPDDLANPVDPDAAYILLNKRARWLQTGFDGLKITREQQAALVDGFDTIVANTLGMPISDVLALAEQNRAGEDIGPALQQLNLPREAFRYLMRTRALAMSADQIVTEDEWTNVYNILLQVQKTREFAAWREAEQTSPLTFSAKYFKVSDSAAELAPWRSTPEARQAWQNTLQARIDQEQTVADGLRAAVAAAEEQVLPLLRDALIKAIAAKLGTAVADPQEWLSTQLAIDVRATAAQQTTRVLQAIETLQGVLFSLRTGRFVTGHPADAWQPAYFDDKGLKKPVTDDHFDAEWKWIGSHATWASAIIAYYYLDILLLPSLRQKQTVAAAHLDPTAPFQKLIDDLNNTAQLTPQQARALAAAYRPVPAPLAGYTLTDQLTQETLAARGAQIRKYYTDQKIAAPHRALSAVQELFYFVPLHLALQLQQAGEYVAALDWYQTIYAYNLMNQRSTAFDERKIYYGLELERNDPPTGLDSRDPHWLWNGLDLHALAVERPNPQTRYLLMSLARCFMEFGDEEFTRDTFESVGRARALYENARQLLELPELQPPSQTGDLIIPPNPVQELLRQRVELQLEKIRQGRNIAGLKRQLDLDTAPDALGALPIAVGGRLVAPGTTALRPTPYHYKVLIERAKQLVQHAAQIEGGLLAALEKADAENYNLLKARLDLRLAQGSVQVQHQRVNEANQGVALAQLQKQRAQIQVDGYQGLISAGFHGLEQQALGLMAEAASLQYKAEGQHYAAAKLPASISYSISVSTGVNAGVTNTFSIGTSPSGEASSIAAALASLAGAKSTQAQSLLTQAGIERAKMEWELQKRVAEEDVLIGDQQVRVAQAHVGVAQAELHVAQMQVDNAEAVINFLGAKFTNVELYNWMSGVLGGVYRYFLQQATAMAMLAQNQLAFERQQPTPNFILTDYWQPSSQSGSAGPNRRGLTGSARLLEDIYQLDQYAFKTDQRKLNLTHTFSLAQLDPIKFQQFRDSGVLQFDTSMHWFDEAFPGHYLRLIKRVRISVIALIPPVQGIRAMLRTRTGFTRVVIGGDAFKEAIIRRDPEMIALSAPSGATGVFELDAQSEMLLPFEGMGVAASWVLEMPKAANYFDYRTIADVLFSIEYTALNSFDYRDQVIKRLNANVGADRAFSLRGEFADQWYDLHNPEQSATPMAVRFSTRREDFPPNLNDLKIEQVALYFARANGKTFDVVVKYLHFTPEDSGQPIGDGATATGDLLSTGSGNVGGWLPMLGKAPVGEWELALADTGNMRQHFKDEEIEDILLVISFGGNRPAWPSSS
jgi:hypothetical protein